MVRYIVEMYDDYAVGVLVGKEFESYVKAQNFTRAASAKHQQLVLMHEYDSKFGDGKIGRHMFSYVDGECVRAFGKAKLRSLP